MMGKKLVIGVLFFLISLPLMAAHIKGGEMYYTYDGPGGQANTALYTITLKLYIDCNATSEGQLETVVPFTIFNNTTNQPIGNFVSAPMVNEQFIRFDPASNPCISNAPSDVCYRIRWFSKQVSLPISKDGYTIAYQRCCRINNINNLIAPSNNAGATYLCQIPGTSQLSDAYMNNSPQFGTNDAAAICAGSFFTLSFAATEKDNDSLVYTFCDGYLGGSQNNPNPTTAAAPPYNSLRYALPFSGSAPLGGAVSIDSKTGIISGTAPTKLGQYVITACIYEYRRGVLINIHHKDIHVAVSDCIPLRALLKPDYSFCDDFKVEFQNGQINPSGSIYIWNYGDGSKPDTSNDLKGKVNHQYADTGTYKVKLKVILAGQCSDSTITMAKVYPGFFPMFNGNGGCILTPLQLSDITRAQYGNADTWLWDFGDETTDADTSHQQNPSWQYQTVGDKTIRLIVTSNKGCKDTVERTFTVFDKPPIALAFKDTLICSIDSLMLQASGNGVYSWTPAARMINSNTANPIVFPKTTTWYKLSLNDRNCINTDSVRVRVVDYVTLDAGADTLICLGDSVQLHPSTDGLYYSWTPAASLSNPAIINPLAFPPGNTSYQLTASIGKCSATDAVNIQTIPYPGSFAGPDTTICFGDTAKLHASIQGIRYQWSPENYLSNPGVLNPQAYPPNTIQYSLFVYDTLGCPKPGISYVQVRVRPKITAFAGNDTAVVVNQPLQLNGQGADYIQWSPSSYLSNPDIPNPIAILSDNFSYVMKAYTPEGCMDTDTINIKVFKTLPDIFVPNAFAPLGVNRILRPIPVGISQFNFFRVYNRWGQLIFETRNAGEGWDGTINGQLQDSGTFVWMASGIDFTGKAIFRKGTAVLVR